jgi:inner membrane protease ATP23
MHAWSSSKAKCEARVAAVIKDMLSYRYADNLGVQARRLSSFPLSSTTFTFTMATNEPEPLIAAPKAVHDEAEASKLCNKWVESGLTGNKAIQFLIQHLQTLGCTPPDRFIQCLQCDKPGAGFFGMVFNEDARAEKCNPDLQKLVGTSPKILPEVYICQQYMENELMTHKTMVHELIHAIDQCRTKMDPVNNCIHIACTEIRAENLSGECSFFKELARMKSFAGHGKECVKRRAILSVRGNPKCAARAEEYVDAAMFRCFQDVYPFARHPNQK